MLFPVIPLLQNVLSPVREYSSTLPEVLIIKFVFASNSNPLPCKCLFWMKAASKSQWKYHFKNIYNKERDTFHNQ